MKFSDVFALVDAEQEAKNTFRMKELTQRIVSVQTNVV